MADLCLLDNPIWNSLSTEHSRFASGDGLARCYLPEVGPLSGLKNVSDAAYEALRPLAGRGGIVGLFLEQPPALPRGWSLIRGAALCQMIRDHGAPAQALAFPSDVQVRRLSAVDIPAMIELAKLTEPGPFRNRTIELGTFFGFFQSNRLLAMAGERMRLPGLIEVSAVCTHPNARGRGFARALISLVVEDIVRTRAMAFLHVLAENEPAIRIYEGLGFSKRRLLHLAVIKNEG
jgi:ribosomal protein S18 acetylase RimI-like enzyme